MLMVDRAFSELTTETEPRASWRDRLDDLEMNGAVEPIQAHVEGTARWTFEARRDAERSGLSDDEWW